MSGMEPLISILIPMHNCEKTIRRCLESLIIQQPSVYEIIILDDGSSDAGGEIVQEFEKEYDFIYAYHQQNSGVAAARQKLVELAQGKYIMFCDADDFFEPDTIEFIYNLLSNKCSRTVEVESADAIIYGYNLVREHTKRVIYGRQLKEGLHFKNEFSKYHVNGFDDLYWSSLWNKCYKTELCRLPQTIKFEKLMEDVMFNIDYLSKCRSVYVARKPLYNYVQIGESLTRTKKVDDRNSIVEASQTYMTLYKKANSAYPGKNKHILANTYIKIKKLKTRASGINDSELQEKLHEKYCELKKSLGAKTYLLNCKYILKELKSKLRAAMRNYL